KFAGAWRAARTGAVDRGSSGPVRDGQTAAGARRESQYRARIQRQRVVAYAKQSGDAPALVGAWRARRIAAAERPDEADRRQRGGGSGEAPAGEQRAGGA